MNLATMVLERCLQAEHDIKELEASYQLAKDVATSVGQRLEDTGDRHAVGTHNERVANSGCELAEIAKAIEARRMARTAEVLAVARMIKRLPALLGKVVNLYYIERKSLQAIAGTLGYSYGYTRQLRVDALGRLGEIPDDDVAGMLPEGYEVITRG